MKQFAYQTLHKYQIVVKHSFLIVPNFVSIILICYVFLFVIIAVEWEQIAQDSIKK